MIVVSDTSPLTALLAVGKCGVLAELFDEVVIPKAVGQELLRCHPQLPAWLGVAAAKDTARVNQYARSVDAGEAEAIELALELHADRLLIDERKGRRLAVQEGLEVIGLLGVILLARRRGIIPSARALLQRLDDEAGMYLSPEIRDAALKSVEE